MTMSLGGAVVLALDIYAIYSILNSRSSSLSKVLWTVTILLLPILGFLAWLLFGPRSVD
ncbi:PLD nuclease N-terminal domain-containing protein [Aliiroseovarius sp. F47248L]|uniref:PLD nuclease N-terminal domain-containing protein n=1 Tax=Aliiroseovarius sp. F47248L TaxID=2926420 RepID=UPI001FF25E52|nr:PLD nuclease N-terminal domain-containing protein [Aliiroseovarius sp. F47248L]MCK0139248.1 PLD nuclease N-terminal domain-containing protein [Aliiroseovarius sp. F47248L]